MDIRSLGKEQIKKIISIFLEKNKKSKEMKDLKELPSESNQALYALTTGDEEKYLICIYDIDVKTQKAIYWMDRFTHYGEIEDVFNDEYITLVIYKRGEKYQNEYLLKHYNRTAGYPMTELIPENEYSDRLSKIKDLFHKINR